MLLKKSVIIFIFCLILLFICIYVYKSRYYLVLNITVVKLCKRLFNIILYLQHSGETKAERYLQAQMTKKDVLMNYYHIIINPITIQI